MKHLSLLIVGGLLALSSILWIDSLSVLSGTVSKAEEILSHAEELQPQDTGVQKEPDETEPPLEDGDSLPTDILCKALCLRESRGKVAVFTSDGALIRLLDIPVSTLPKADQEALKAGIEATSWKEVFDLIADFGG